MASYNCLSKSKLDSFFDLIFPIISNTFFSFVFSSIIPIDLFNRSNLFLSVVSMLASDSFILIMND